MQDSRKRTDNEIDDVFAFFFEREQRRLVDLLALWMKDLSKSKDGLEHLSGWINCHSECFPPLTQLIIMPTHTTSMDLQLETDDHVADSGCHSPALDDSSDDGSDQEGGAWDEAVDLSLLATLERESLMFESSFSRSIAPLPMRP